MDNYGSTSNITYDWLPSSLILGNDCLEGLVQECSQLYSTQYGKWGQSAPRNRGENIKLSPTRLRKWLEDENVSLYYAKDGDTLVGYAIALQLSIPNYGIISWVTQLVVHSAYRHQEIAKHLLHSIWGFTDNYAWGIISANPYAIRALEKTTRRRSDPVRIKHNLKKIISIGIEHLPYMNETTETFVNKEVSKINTEFFVDHSDVPQMVENVVNDSVPWTLGELEEGWEWIAFTFQDQLPFELTNEEIESMLDASDRVVRNAYKRMDITTGRHFWTKNSEKEVDFIISESGLRSGGSLIDFGCGQGRHSLALAKRGVLVTAIDYIEKNIEIANKSKETQKLDNITFLSGDCRDISLSEQADVAICLYDVIGTYADNRENQRILLNISRHLKPGGIAFISVMNYQLTLSQAKHTFILRDNPSALLDLKPSRIMETTGNIFDPEYYLVDTETGIIYRREQFRNGRSLPVELIVRDKRFTVGEIRSMCEAVGFEILYDRFVSAKDWETGFCATDSAAKEILLKCRKKAE